MPGGIQQHVNLRIAAGQRGKVCHAIAIPVSGHQRNPSLPHRVGRAGSKGAAPVVLVDSHLLTLRADHRQIYATQTTEAGGHQRFRSVTRVVAHSRLEAAIAIARKNRNGVAGEVGHGKIHLCIAVQVGGRNRDRP